MQVVARKTSTTASACVSRYRAALSGRLSITKLCAISVRPGSARSKESRVSVRMQAAPVNLNAEQLLEADIAEVDRVAEVAQEVELRALVGRLEDRPFHAECVREGFRGIEVQPTGIVEQPDRLRALARLDTVLTGAGVQPAGNRNLQPADQVMARLEMADARGHVVARVEGAGPWWHVGNAERTHELMRARRLRRPGGGACVNQVAGRLLPRG